MEEQKVKNIIDNLETFYNQLTVKNIDELSSIYSDNIIFVDPAHQIKGIDNLKNYFLNMYSNIHECHFSFKNIIIKHDICIIEWDMSFKHPKLFKGYSRTVEGASILKMSDDRIYYHRDYIDLGSMIYEGIPILSWFIRKIKKSLNK